MECFANAKHELKDFRGVIELFAKHTAIDTAKALPMLHDAIKELPLALSSCKAAEKDVEDMAKAIDAFGEPADFGYNVGENMLLNGVDIYHEIEAAIAAEKADRLEDMGTQ